MSKPSATTRRRTFAPGYHRHHLGGGNALKAVTRVRRAAAGKTLGHPTGRLRAEQKALARLLNVAQQLEQTADLVTPRHHREPVQADHREEEAA